MEESEARGAWQRSSKVEKNEMPELMTSDNKKVVHSKSPREKKKGLDLVHVVEVEEVVVFVSFLLEGVRLVDADGVRELAVRLERARLVRQVLEDDIRLLILEVSQTEEDDITRVDPHLFAHLPANVAQTLHAVDALRLQTAVAQHAKHLRVLLTILLEDQLALLVALVLSSAAVLTSLPCFFSDGVAEVVVGKGGEGDVGYLVFFYWKAFDRGKGRALWSWDWRTRFSLAPGTRQLAWMR